ncbi:MAG: 1-phosphofructokinase [Lachnospiraceae bacterium]|nr:1-phosphofructokinase [Lachnospiraceae bacterium]
MITTITLNPAVDKTYTTARFLPGQVNRMDSAKSIAGGKGINVAKVLHQYGMDVRTMGFLGGYAGRFIEDYAESLGAECRFTHVSGETRTSINILSQDGYVTEVLEPGPEISEKELAQFHRDYEKELDNSELIILSGSAPANVKASIYKDLITKAKDRGKKVFLDSSGEYLKEGAIAAPFMIKPNSRELEILIGRKLRGIEDIIGAALTLGERGIEHVMVSMGDKGLLYVAGKQILYAKAPKIKVVNTVGCGDCVVAAFAMGYLQKMSTEEMLRYCVALSAANATTLESAVIPKEKAEELLSEVKIEQY